MLKGFKLPAAYNMKYTINEREIHCISVMLNNIINCVRYVECTTVIKITLK